jgi:hypothetical protein
MKLSQIDRTNFSAGLIQLKRVNKNKIASIDAIKKIAEDRDIDIFISKNQKSKYLPLEDMYMIMASKDVPLIRRGFFSAGYVTKHGMGCVIVNKKVSNEELSVKIFNASMSALDVLEKKLADLTKNGK